MEAEEQLYQNWTVNSGQHNLDISALQPGKQYWITVAAVNGAGVGMLSDPHGFVISEQGGASGKFFLYQLCKLTTVKTRSYDDLLLDFFCFLLTIQTQRQGVSPNQTAKDMVCLKSWPCFRTQW